MPPIRSILAAVDLSTEPNRDRALAVAGALAKHTGAALHVLHAVEGGGSGTTDSPAFARLREEDRRRLDEHVRHAITSTLPASATVLAGSPARALVERAAAVDADLIVLTTHRGTGVRDHFIGTTADRVLRTANVPCLVVRAPVRLPLRRVGIPTDFSVASRHALDLALEWADSLGDSRTEFDVIYQEWTVTLQDDPSIAERTLLPRIEREIEEAMTRAGTERRPHIRPVVFAGVDPGKGISDYASERELDLIVMGTHGLGAIKRALIGSVASSVARQAPCSVLLTPPEELP